MTLLWFLGLWLVLAMVTAPVVGWFLRRARWSEVWTDGKRRRRLTRTYRVPHTVTFEVEGPESATPLDFCERLRRRGLR